MGTEVTGSTLVIRVNMTDEQDFDWLRNKCVAAVENTVEEESARLDGTADVEWDEES